MPYVRITFLSLLLALPAIARAETLPDIAARAKPGILGVAVYDFQDGVMQGVNLSRPFMMQSVFKCFLSAMVLSQVDAGAISLDQTVTLTLKDIRSGGDGTIDKSGGGTFPVRELLEAALTQSDNTAADALLRLIGGPAQVTAWLQGKGFTGIRLDRDERTISRDENGIPPTLSPDKNAADLRYDIPKEQRHAGFVAALTDPRDTATPEAAVRFLVALKRGEVLSPASTALLLGWMEKAKTGQKRLKAGFPKGTVLAHKTGTSGIFEGLCLATNDIGIATLPDGRTLAIAVFLANSPASDDARDAFIADCARAVSKPAAR